jgi:hypothetical protein
MDRFRFSDGTTNQVYGGQAVRTAQWWQFASSNWKDNFALARVVESRCARGEALRCGIQGRVYWTARLLFPTEKLAHLHKRNASGKQTT